MSDWLPLEWRELARSVTKHLNGPHATVTLSPYDIPQAVRCELDGDAQRLFIEFRYMDDSERRKDLDTKEPGLSFKIGRNSGRLYQIVWDYQNAPPEVSAAIGYLHDAISRVAHREKVWRRGENYNLANYILDSKYPQLFPQYATG